VRNIVDLHGGTVAAYSQGPGQGSVFTLSLATVPD
jgi:signal transduction histidine kinase